jgi:beta-mannosidase
MNDAWPAISWSSIDYFGRWKPLQFMAKRLYPDIAIFYTGNSISVISDKLYPVDARVIIQLVTFSGEYLLNVTENVHLLPN